MADQIMEVVDKCGVFDDKNILSEKKRKIERYFNEVLEGEERIARPMHSDCKVSVVVPVYGERKTIFRLLKSFTEQEDVDSDDFEIILVVNNSPEEPTPQGLTDGEYLEKLKLYKESVVENQEVLNIVKEINEGGDLSNWLSHGEKEIAESVRDKKINIHVIDKTSSGRELPAEKANVGGARNRGVVEAAERFYGIEKNGIVAQTDGDCRVDKKYIKNIIEFFEKNNNLVGAKGDMEFELQEKGGIEEITSLYDGIRYYYEHILVMVNDGSKGNFDNSEKISFSGANMMSRAYETALVKGVPEIPGGEDPEFGRRLETVGKIGFTKEVVTYPEDRFSARTAEDSGHGQQMLKYRRTLERGEDIKTETLERRKFEESVREQLGVLLGRGNVMVDELKDIFSMNGESVYNQEELKFLEDKFSNAHSMEDVDMTTDEMKKMRKKLVKLLDKHFPRIKIETAAREVLEKLKNDKNIKRLFLENKSKFIDGVGQAILEDDGDNVALLNNLKEMVLDLEIMEKTLKEMISTRAFYAEWGFLY